MADSFSSNSVCGEPCNWSTTKSSLVPLHRFCPFLYLCPWWQSWASQQLRSRTLRAFGRNWCHPLATADCLLTSLMAPFASFFVPDHVFYFGFWYCLETEASWLHVEAARCNRSPGELPPSLSTHNTKTHALPETSKNWKRVPACSHHLRYLHMSPITTLTLLLQILDGRKRKRCNSHNTLQYLKNLTAFAIQVNKNTACLSHRQEKQQNSLIRSVRKRRSLRSLLRWASTSVRLRASSNAAVGLFIRASHNACRTVTLLSCCRSLLRSDCHLRFTGSPRASVLWSVCHTLHVVTHEIGKLLLRSDQFVLFCMIETLSGFLQSYTLHTTSCSASSHASWETHRCGLQIETDDYEGTRTTVWSLLVPRLAQRSASGSPCSAARYSSAPRPFAPLRCDTLAASLCPRVERVTAIPAHLTTYSTTFIASFNKCLARHFDCRSFPHSCDQTLHTESGRQFASKDLLFDHGLPTCIGHFWFAYFCPSEVVAVSTEVDRVRYSFTFHKNGCNTVTPAICG